MCYIIIFKLIIQAEESMENQNIPPDKEKNAPNGGGNYFLKITVTEAIFVILTLIFIISVKYFWSEGYSAIAEWYGKNMTADTSAEEIISSLSDGEADEI